MLQISACSSCKPDHRSSESLSVATTSTARMVNVAAPILTVSDIVSTTEFLKNNADIQRQVADTFKNFTLHRYHLKVNETLNGGVY